MRRTWRPGFRQAQDEQLHWRLGGDMDGQVLVEAMAVLPPLRRARRMGHAAGVPGAAGGWRHAPDRRCLLIAQVDRFARRIADHIVAPGSQAVLAAVAGPGEAATGLRDDASQAVVGDHVAPGLGEMRARVELDHIVRPTGCEAAVAIVEGEVGAPFQPGDRHGGRPGDRDERRHGLPDVLGDPERPATDCRRFRRATPAPRCAGPRSPARRSVRRREGGCLPLRPSPRRRPHRASPRSIAGVSVPRSPPRPRAGS